VTRHKGTNFDTIETCKIVHRYIILGSKLTIIKDLTSAVGAGDAAATPSKIFLGKIG